MRNLTNLIENVKLIPIAKSGIHIDPKNKGKFTASAKRAGEGVQEHARNVMKNNSSTPLQRKRATFALNSKKWHK